jgi:hypothetical protein
MGNPKRFKPGNSFRVGVALGACLGLCFVGGCQIGPTVTTQRLLTHQVLIDFTGLKPAQPIDALRVTISPPRDWELIETRKSSLFTHQQWRSPTHGNAVGVAFMKMPLPFGARMIAWLAKHEYAKQASDGKVLGEWTDSLGRPWFEAENSKYHIRGYVMTRGTEAWIVYYGCKLNTPPQAEEMSLAARSMETIVPMEPGASTATAQAAAR